MPDKWGHVLRHECPVLSKWHPFTSPVQADGPYGWSGHSRAAMLLPSPTSSCTACPTASRTSFHMSLPGHPPCPAQPSSTTQWESWGAAFHPSLVLPCLCGVHPPPGPATSQGGTALHPPPRPAALAHLHASLSPNPVTWCPGTCRPGRSWHILTLKGTIPRRERREEETEAQRAPLLPQHHGSRGASPLPGSWALLGPSAVGCPCKRV